MQPRPDVLAFERRLDRALRQRPAYRGGADAIHAAANVAEIAWAEGGLLGEQFTQGLEILAPVLIARGGDEIAVEHLVDDLLFASHYWRIREFLYFTYNAPETVAWRFRAGRVDIAYADDSLPRQFFLVANNWFVESRDAFQPYHEKTSRIEDLLRGAPEFEWTQAADEALALIEEEAATKLALYFNLVPEVDAPLGDLSFHELIETYRCLLVKALYHRYHASLNGTRGALVLPLEDISRDLAASSDLTRDVARAAVRYMSYGPESGSRRENPVYFSLYRLPPDERVVMMPHDFAVWEAFARLLRLIAIRNPQSYLRYFSEPVGKALTQRVAAAFDEAGFSCCTNVSLRRYSKDLPDIDVLVISEEPTLGYVLFLCEVKAPLPPGWSKDQLRVLAPDSVAKAFDQLGRIAEFIASDEGVAFVRDALPADGLPSFDEFAVLVFGLVVTSDNAGAFFSGRNEAVIDFRTLSRLLRACDGDTHYVLSVLRELPQQAERCLARGTAEVQVGDERVVYEGITVERLLEFGQARFRSQALPEQMVADMLRSGDRPLDVLRERGDLETDAGD